MSNALALDLASALDPVALCQRVAMEPDDWQIRALRSDSRRSLWNISRQAGKSTTAALLAVHQAVYQPGSLTLMLSPSQRQSGELFKRARGFYQSLGRPVAAEAESALTLALENGSRIVALPGQSATIRGYSGVDLLIIDEASQVADELYASIRPMLAVSDGKLLALSTPYGTRGWWYEAWRSNEKWTRETVTAYDCPRIPADFLAEERRVLGEWWYAQEYENKFMSADTQAFNRDDVEATIRKDVEPWQFTLAQ